MTRSSSYPACLQIQPPSSWKILGQTFHLLRIRSTCSGGTPLSVSSCSGCGSPDKNLAKSLTSGPKSKGPPQINCISFLKMMPAIIWLRLSASVYFSWLNLGHGPFSCDGHKGAMYSRHVRRTKSATNQSCRGEWSGAALLNLGCEQSAL